MIGVFVLCIGYFSIGYFSIGYSVENRLIEEPIFLVGGVVGIGGVMGIGGVLILTSFSKNTQRKIFHGLEFIKKMFEDDCQCCKCQNCGLNHNHYTH